MPEIGQGLGVLQGHRWSLISRQAELTPAGSHSRGPEGATELAGDPAPWPCTVGGEGGHMCRAPGKRAGGRGTNRYRYQIRDVPERRNGALGKAVSGRPETGTEARSAGKAGRQKGSGGPGAASRGSQPRPIQDPLHRQLGGQARGVYT